MARKLVCGDGVGVEGVAHGPHGDEEQGGRLGAWYPVWPVSYSAVVFLCAPCGRGPPLRRSADLRF